MNKIIGYTELPPIARRVLAFTLIELLVVISIIALLIAILLPSLQSARDLAKSIACASNNRQIGIGMAAYAQDSDGWLMPTNEVSKYTWNGTASVGAVGNIYGWVNYMEMKYFGGTKIVDAQRPPQIWACPASTAVANYAHGGLSDYARNVFTGQSNISNSYPTYNSAYGIKRIASILNPSSVMTASDAISPRNTNVPSVPLGAELCTRSLSPYAGLNDGAWGGEGNLSFRHSQTANLLYVDFHVGKLTGTKDTATGSYVATEPIPWRPVVN